MRTFLLGAAKVAAAALAVMAVAGVTSGAAAEDPTRHKLEKRVAALEAEVLRLDGVVSDHREWLDGLSLEVAFAELDGYRRDRRIARCTFRMERREARCVDRWRANP